jgi:hypothetical protein
VGLERGPLRLVNTIEELLGRKSSGSGLEPREYGHRDPSSWPCGTPYSKNLAITSLTSGGLSVGLVRSRTQATDFNFYLPPPPIFLTSKNKIQGSLWILILFVHFLFPNPCQL